MKLIEADGKRLLRDAGIAVPIGFLVSPDQPTAFSLPCVLKAQILSGRRGQRGLVRRAVDDASFREAITAIRHLLAAIPNAGIYVEEDMPHQSEWLVSFDFDRLDGSFRISYSEQGGMDVGCATFVRMTKEDALTLLPEQIRDVAKHLIVLAKRHDALSIEINPLAIRTDGSCVALDAKIELDDAAAGRHPEWESLVRVPVTDKKPTDREIAYTSFLEEGGYRGTFGRYVELDGDIALILSGGGASLVALDALERVGLKAANYCEISGNPDPDRTTRAAMIVLSHPRIKALWMAGSFANFTDIQSTVMAVLAGVDASKLQIPIVIRRDGPNADAAERQAMDWANERGISLTFHRGDVDLDSSAAALAAIVQTV